MYLVVVMYFYILQLAGVSMDTSSLKAMTSGDSDMIFNFLINNEEMVSQILRNFTALAIIMIIVTAIIAIIKQQFASLKEKDIKKAKVNNGSCAYRHYSFNCNSWNYRFKRIVASTL